MIPLTALWLILPAYIANASAVILGGGKPIDFGKTWKGKPVFGPGKTWKGFIGGVGLGSLVGYLQAFFFPDSFGGYPVLLITVFSLSLGALAGDLVESFMKRRLGKNRGEKWLVADQLDFVTGACCLCFLGSEALRRGGISPGNWFLETFSVWHVVFLFLFTPFLHYSINYVGYKLGLKEVPW